MAVIGVVIEATADIAELLPAVSRAAIWYWLAFPA